MKPVGRVEDAFAMRSGKSPQDHHLQADKAFADYFSALVDPFASVAASAAMYESWLKVGPAAQAWWREVLAHPSALSGHAVSPSAAAATAELGRHLQVLFGGGGFPQPPSTSPIQKAMLNRVFSSLSTGQR
jgi:hypothetical protein